MMLRKAGEAPGQLCFWYQFGTRRMMFGENEERAFGSLAAVGNSLHPVRHAHVAVHRRGSGEMPVCWPREPLTGDA